ncbi:MAG TPA: diadenylate cyclase CdaA [Anaeromyxobacteraceae bacterium]|nr:diadenylate cyclase CdaA [Anaeromyxobacteraceae bacterium]
MPLVLRDLVQYLLGPGTTWRDLLEAAVDVAVVSYLIYRALLVIRGTRAIQVLVGLLVLGLGYLASQWANLITVNWLLGHFLTYSFIFGVIVLFQADIRRGLASLGRRRFLNAFVPDERRLQAGAVEVVTRAAVELSRKRQGALVVIERVADLGEVLETGVRLDAELSYELLLALFQPGGALHDGAVVLRRGRVAAAGCILPLTAVQVRDLGTRHRAALGLAEEVDAVVVVVSEERGEISLAVEGTLHRALDEGALRQHLARLLVPPGATPGTKQPAAGPARRDPEREDDRAAV